MMALPDCRLQTHLAAPCSMHMQEAQNIHTGFCVPNQTCIDIDSSIHKFGILILVLSAGLPVQIYL